MVLGAGIRHLRLLWGERPESQLSAQQVLGNRKSRLSDTEMEMKPKMPAEIYEHGDEWHDM